MTKKFTKGIFIFFSIAATLLVIIIAVIFAARLFLVFEDDGNVSALGNETEGASATEQEDERLNVLVMGKDETSGLYDMMMLVSYNMTDEIINVVQIPRDTYLEYTEGSYRKINGAVSSLGGEKEFCDFLSQAMCVAIDQYVSIDLEGMGEIVDVLGGVEVNIPFDMYYEDAAQGLSIRLKKGTNLLDGEMAQQFVRYRSGYTEGDLGRIDAQKIFLAALVKKIKSDISFFDIAAIVGAVADDIKTDIPIVNIISLAKQVFSVPSENIKFVTLAGEGAVAKSSGASYYVISRPSAIEIVNELLGGDADEESFDRDRAFLNEKYESFGDIYYSRAKYEVYDYNSIISAGIDIAHK